MGNSDWPRPVVLALETLLVALGYYASGRLGLLRQMTVEGAVVTPMWPPTGVAVACLLILGPRCLAGIAVGALLIVMSLTALRPTAAGIVAGNTAAPLCAWLLLRAVGFRNDLSRLRDGLALVFLGAFTSMAISAGVGVGMIVLTHQLAAEHFWALWLAWWVGDAMGVVLVTPLLLVLHRVRRPPRGVHWAEAAALAVIVCCLVPVLAYSTISLLFLVFPLLIWAALRFQLAGSMACALFASVMATVTATAGVGSFTGLTEPEVMMKLQAFNGGVALTALLLSALITEQRTTRRSVERACAELVEALQHLSAGEAARPRPVEEEDR